MQQDEEALEVEEMTREFIPRFPAYDLSRRYKGHGDCQSLGPNVFCYLCAPKYSKNTNGEGCDIDSEENDIQVHALELLQSKCSARQVAQAIVSIYNASVRDNTIWENDAGEVFYGPPFLETTAVYHLLHREPFCYYTAAELSQQVHLKTMHTCNENMMRANGLVDPDMYKLFCMSEDRYIRSIKNHKQIQQQQLQQQQQKYG